MSWQEEAACAGMGPDLFFPSSGTDTLEPAKALCRRCPVRDACLIEALEEGHEGGVWGGLDEPARRKLRGQMRRGIRPVVDGVELSVSLREEAA